ncbi:response regulator [Dyella sp. 20L07]|uniref:response regulator n=1 Tax=Dyella sp. 20L07 TaxID=3384240 RepID=UPI003D29953B
MATRIILADDHPIVSSGTRMLLERDSSLQVVAVAASPDELLGALDAHECDLVITDYIMPAGNTADGLGLLGLMQRRWPKLPVVVMTSLSNPAILRSIQTSGVRALINKADALGELPAALRAVSRGKVYLSKSVRELLDDGLVAAAAPTVTKVLSPKEAEVLRLFASGFTVTDIAKQLNRSVKTISGQKSEAMSKLGLRSDIDVYAYARENGLIA